MHLAGLDWHDEQTQCCMLCLAYLLHFLSISAAFAYSLLRYIFECTAVLVMLYVYSMS